MPSDFLNFLFFLGIKKNELINFLRLLLNLNSKRTLNERFDYVETALR